MEQKEQHIVYHDRMHIIADEQIAFDLDFCLDDVSYDILVETENCLYKHVEERMVTRSGVSDSLDEN